MDGLGKGQIYLIEEERLDLGAQLFLRAAANKRGLIISRDPLDNLEFRDQLQPEQRYRLSMTFEDLEHLSPHNLPRLGYLITNFVEQRSLGVVLLEGLEYLSTQNNFKTVLRMVQFLYDKVAVSRSIMIISVNPLAFELKDLHLLKSETVRPPMSVMDDLEAHTSVGLPKARP